MEFMVAPSFRLAADIHCKEELLQMQTVQNIIFLLKKKQDLFLEFEHYTNLLTTCDINDMANYITKRSDLANEIENVTGKIINLARADAVSPSVETILANNCAYAEVPLEWQPVFLEAQKLSGIIVRCIEVNEQALWRMSDMRSHLKERITQTKNTPRIIKYLTSSGAIQQERSISIKNKKI